MKNELKVGFLAFLLSTFSFIGCDKQTVVTDETIASVGDAVLTASHLREVVPHTGSSIDSAVIADEYIRRWVLDQVLYQKAKFNLTDEEFNIEQEVEAYRNALIVEKYQQKLIAQKFHPRISQQDIEEYYESMKSNFLLSESIVKCVFAVFPKKATDLQKFKRKLERYDESMFAEYEKYMFDHSLSYDSSADTWKTFSSVKALLPTDCVKNETTFLKSQSLHVFEDDGKCFVLKILDYRLADDYAPLEYVTDNIYAILLNKEKVRFLDNVKRELYENALNADAIKFYYIK